MGTCNVVIVSTLIIGQMPKKGDVIQFQDPHQTLLVIRIIDGFVEYTAIWENLLKGLDSLSRGPIKK